MSTKLEAIRRKREQHATKVWLKHYQYGICATAQDGIEAARLAAVEKKLKKCDGHKRESDDDIY